MIPPVLPTDRGGYDGILRAFSSSTPPIVGQRSMVGFFADLNDERTQYFGNFYCENMDKLPDEQDLQRHALAFIEKANA
ncbi:MAG: hypothetical protein OXR68_02810 [Alphaproteobacteria bacterium]|nr:hypothetical protein [Alphaproteobacteria bacterium]MDD9919534.1 hypothetical protein [Alphaproteobacteria bacterium]